MAAALVGALVDDRTRTVRVLTVTPEPAGFLAALADASAVVGAGDFRTGTDFRATCAGGFGLSPELRRAAGVVAAGVAGRGVVVVADPAWLADVATWAVVAACAVAF